MEFDDFKLFFIIVFAGMTLLLVNNALDKKKLNAFSGGVDASKSTSRSYQQSSTLNYDEQLALAVERQKALQANSIKNKVDNYMSALKEKYTKKEFAQKLAVCNYYTDVFKKNRTKLNELKYVRACDPKYH
ncbi:hypothetical protein [uncultured Pseudoalteromonas sp.]|uniref:hypothetical protein n=1 Tax=uncultured Pseudoalteromonas sp. TaxID=114053 RepID=UPI002597919B|nr:hypothetical protein [uncultured Pseudoalteromonas sp.]